MTTMTITAMEPHHFGELIEEGDLTTSHRVRLPPALVDDLQLRDVDPERIVRESVAFLLDRAHATEVPSDLSLDEVGRTFPEYYDELRHRLAMG